MFSVSAAIPNGSIDVVVAEDPSDVRLKLRVDAGDSPFLYYFHFRVAGARGTPCRFSLLNAAEVLKTRLASHANLEGRWSNTGVMASYDRRDWFRVPLTERDGVVSWSHTPERDHVYFAMWPPYSAERRLDLLGELQMSSRVRLEVLGRSVGGRDMDLVTIGEPAPGRRICWIIARQHPSETMGGPLVEGFLRRLTDPDDAVSVALLDRAVFHVVPDMNPDGSDLGLSRANLAGANLNREWVSPTMERSPEVKLVRDRMELTGVDFCIDCHGDAQLRCNFLGGPLEIPSRSERLKGLFNAFERSWAAVSPDYELGHPYPGGSPAQADLSMAWNWIAERFGCLSVLLEQPFKDTSWRQDARTGWSPPRAIRFGAALPAAILGVVDRLR
jgi:murein tripeptide amidase MpaA